MGKWGFPYFDFNQSWLSRISPAAASRFLAPGFVATCANNSLRWIEGQIWIGRIFNLIQVWISIGLNLRWISDKGRHQFYLNGTCGLENCILHFCVAQKNLMLPKSLFLDLILWSLYSAGPRMMEQLQEIGHFFTQALRPPFHGFLFYWPASEHFLCNLSAELKTPRGQRCLALGSYPLLFILSASRYHILLMEVDTFRIH